jgi:hypothetical protein
MIFYFTICATTEFSSTNSFGSNSIAYVAADYGREKLIYVELIGLSLC